MNYTEIIQDICKQLKKEIYREDRSDHSFKAKIVEKINDTKYKVLYCGKTYTVSSSIICEVGGMVRVCAPCNNWQDLFVICKTR